MEPQPHSRATGYQPAARPWLQRQAEPRFKGDQLGRLDDPWFVARHDDLRSCSIVTILDSAGKKLAHREGFQHNRKLRSGGSWDGSAVEALVEEAATALAK